VWLLTVFVKKVTWAAGSSLLCSQYTSGWTSPCAPLKKILDPPMIFIWELLHLAICLSNLCTRCEARPDSPLRERRRSLKFI